MSPGLASLPETDAGCSLGCLDSDTKAVRKELRAVPLVVSDGGVIIMGGKTGSRDRASRQARRLQGPLSILQLPCRETGACGRIAASVRRRSCPAAGVLRLSPSQSALEAPCDHHQERKLLESDAASPPPNCRRGHFLEELCCAYLMAVLFLPVLFFYCLHWGNCVISHKI